jgi:hypothetical protein
MVFCYIFHRFGMLCQEKSGNPGWKDKETNKGKPTKSQTK